MGKRARRGEDKRETHRRDAGHGTHEHRAQRGDPTAPPLRFLAAIRGNNDAQRDEDNECPDFGVDAEPKTQSTGGQPTWPSESELIEAAANTKETEQNDIRFEQQRAVGKHRSGKHSHHESRERGDRRALEPEDTPGQVRVQPRDQGGDDSCDRERVTAPDVACHKGEGREQDGDARRLDEREVTVGEVTGHQAERRSEVGTVVVLDDAEQTVFSREPDADDRGRERPGNTGPN
jgi:hypothetical protein